MGDMHLVLPALKLSTLNSCILIMMGWAAHEILMSAQGPFWVFWVLGLRVWGQGLTIRLIHNHLFINLSIYLSNRQVLRPLRHCINELVRMWVWYCLGSTICWNFILYHSKHFYLLLNNKLKKLYKIVGDGKYDNKENKGPTFPKALKDMNVSTNY